MRTLTALLLLPLVAVRRRLSWAGYSVDPSRLPRRAFSHLPISFIRCPGCGDDGQLIIGNVRIAQVFTHYAAIKMLADWGNSLSVAQYVVLYSQVAAADWLDGHQTMAPLPTEPSFAQVDLIVRSYL